MKNNLIHFSCLLLLSLLVSLPNQIYAQKVKVEFERVKKKCKKLPMEERVRLTVSRFNVTTRTAKAQFGDELATMLTNALQQVNCFRILQSTKNIDDSMGEIGMGEMGYTNGSSSPQMGKMLGAQAIVTGEVTEFYEGEGSGGFGGIKLSKNKARIGFILQVTNPQTREVLWSKSIEAVGKKPGKFGGIKLLGFELAGGNMHNTAIGDAVERAIIKAVQALADEREDIPFPKPNSGLAANKVWDTSNCPFVNTPTPPSIMILMSEKHIHRYLSKPNSEASLINKFANAGFIVIDPSVYATVRKGARFEEALKNQIAAASLASEFGADIIVIGEAVSQRLNNNKNGRVVCRAAINARVVRVSNSQILMAHSLEAGANDMVETSASNAALRNAGSLLADNLLNQFCTRTFNGLGGSMAAKGPGTSVRLETSYLNISKTDFKKLKLLTDLLKAESIVKQVTRSSFKKSNATLEIEHEGSMDDLLDIISTKVDNLCEIKGFNDNEIDIKMK